MLAVIQTQLHMLIMVGVGRGDVNKLHLRIAYHLFITAVGFRKSKFPRKRLRPAQIAGSHREAFHAIHFPDGARHGSCDGARA